MSIVEVKTRILAGGRVEIPSTNLPEGSEATVRIVVEEPKRKLSEILAEFHNKQDSQPEKRSFLENLGDYKGGQSFRSAEEVDQYLREERDSWGDRRSPRRVRSEIGRPVRGDPIIHP